MIYQTVAAKRGAAAEALESVVLIAYQTIRTGEIRKPDATNSWPRQL
jgi:hypothetical protein